MKEKHGRPPKARAFKIEESSKYNGNDDQVAHTEDSPISARGRQPERNIKQQKSYPFCMKQTRSKANGDMDINSERFSIRRQKCTENGVFDKRMSVISWLIDAGMIQENEEIFSLGEKLENKGRLRRDGILCLCCNVLFSVANFNAHSGGRNPDKPYQSVFIAGKNVSLLSYTIEAWNKPEELQRRRPNVIETKGNASDLYDDVCMICADGGDLMCCEDCNSTYHQVCMGMEDVPGGSWYCPYCVCKYCERPAYENDYLLKCPQCEKRYHWECHQTNGQRTMDLNVVPVAPFCELSCKGVYDTLAKNMVGRRNKVDDEGYWWTLLRQMDDDSDGVSIENKYLRSICHSKLAVARKLMEECFEPIQDRYTRIAMIPSIVYNCQANFNRINFKGFYTAVLENDDEIISVASLRIHGTKLAEMSFIATSEAYRCRGMCKKLMDAIESALCHLNVDNLIIPSVPERIEYWIERYGFRELDASMRKEIMVRNTLTFHDSVRLQKILSHNPQKLIPCGTRELHQLIQ